MKDKEQRDEPRIEVLLEYANSIIATLREPFLVLDKNLRVISSNYAFYTTFEVAEKDTIGRLLPNLGDRQWNIPKLLQLLNQIVSQKKVVKDYEVEHKFERIGQRVMVLNARQLFVPGTIAAIITAGVRKEQEEALILIAIEDITDRKRLQDELKESEECYRRAFETSRNVLLLVHKINGDILHSNESAQEFLGYSPEEFLKTKLWEIGMIKDEKDFRETVSILKKDGTIHYQGILLKTQKGLSIDAEVFLIDRAKVIQCNIRNITERKEADEALKESEMRFKAIFNGSMDGMLLTEKETKGFFMCNPTICLMLGYTEEELMRLGMDDIYPEGDPPLVVEKFEEQAKGKDKVAVGLPVKRKDGSIFYADIGTSQVNLSGKNYLMRSFRDVTERKKNTR